MSSRWMCYLKKNLLWNDVSWNELLVTARLDEIVALIELVWIQMRLATKVVVIQLETYVLGLLYGMADARGSPALE